MPLVEAIAHRLTRIENERSYHLRDSSFNNTEPASRLLTETKTLFARRKRRFGRFNEEPTAFRGLLNNYLDGTHSFIKFTQSVVEQLAMHFDQEDAESDSRWLFAIDSHEERSSLWIAQLNLKEGLVLSDENQLHDVEWLDFTHTGCCLQIDLNDYQAKAPAPFFTLSFGFGDRALQPVLLSFFGFTDTVDASADTERFMQVVKEYAQGLPEPVARQYQKDVAEYCIEQDKNGEQVDYRELSREVTCEAPVPFEAFVQSNEPELKESFIPDTKSLKRYIRYTGRSKEVSISFSNESLGHNVQFDAENETLTLTKLPAALVKQLKGES